MGKFSFKCFSTCGILHHRPRGAPTALCIWLRQYRGHNEPSENSAFTLLLDILTGEVWKCMCVCVRACTIPFVELFRTTCEEQAEQFLRKEIFLNRIFLQNDHPEQVFKGDSPVMTVPVDWAAFPRHFPSLPHTHTLPTSAYPPSSQPPIINTSW